MHNSFSARSDRHARCDPDSLHDPGAVGSRRASLGTQQLQHSRNAALDSRLECCAALALRIGVGGIKAVAAPSHEFVRIALRDLFRSQTLEAPKVNFIEFAELLELVRVTGDEPRRFRRTRKAAGEDMGET